MTDSMRSAIAILAALGAAAGLTVSAQQSDTDDALPSFRAGVDVVSLNVTVTDADNRFVTDLDQENFQIFEDGVLQEITFFSRARLPIALSVLIDTSASMDKRMRTAQEAAIGFSRSLGPDDLAEIIDFDGRVEILQDFTNDLELLGEAIRQTSAGGSTSLYNALYVALKDLSKAPLRPSEVRRQAIVMLSDGEDTSSLITFDEVLELAKRSETGIYTIGLQEEEDERSGFREADFVLRQLAYETGGRAFFPEDVNDLPAIYQQISDEISSQYSVGYISANPLRNGQWRRTVVRVDRERTTARTKQGYYAPTGS
ncbi:MAG: VWA domain-containing protein [Acidobacteria bacterium]|nr:VWA domain-containing protein [Acidobacteriota bacterium]